MIKIVCFPLDICMAYTLYLGCIIFSKIYINTSELKQTGGRLNKKDGLTRYGNSHVKDKTS